MSMQVPMVGYQPIDSKTMDFLFRSEIMPNISEYPGFSFDEEGNAHFEYACEEVRVDRTIHFPYLSEESHVFDTLYFHCGFYAFEGEGSLTQSDAMVKMEVDSEDGLKLVFPDCLVALDIPVSPSGNPALVDYGCQIISLPEGMTTELASHVSTRCLNLTNATLGPILGKGWGKVRIIGQLVIRGIDTEKAMVA